MSYFTLNTFLALQLPARSLQRPAIFPSADSGPVYRRTEQCAIPDVASAPLSSNVTGRLNQPFLSARRLGTARVTEGALRSTLTVTRDVTTSASLFLARHLSVVPLVSPRVVVSQPFVFLIPDSGSLTAQVTVGEVRYQPLLERSPVMRGTITGAVRSVAARAGRHSPATGASNGGTGAV